jgi:mxaJ protein
MCSSFLRGAAFAGLLVIASGIQARELRVCADPNNLPFSNEAGEGFENKIVSLVAQELNAEIRYTWWAQRRGFLRNTLKAETCDLVTGLPANLEGVRTTTPYYRSSYVFVTRTGSPSGEDWHSPHRRRWLEHASRPCAVPPWHHR